MMNFTVSSRADPQRDSCPTLGEANPARNNSASRHAGMIDVNFIALGFFRLYLTPIAGQAFSSLRTKALDADRTDIDGYSIGSIVQDART
jgi:hypothetical protein